MRASFTQRLSEFTGVIRNHEILTECLNISRYVLEKNYYRALMACRRLIEYEDERLSDVSSSLSTGGAAG